MPVDYRYNAKERTIEVLCSGELVIEEIFEYFAEIRDDSSIKQGSVELVDLSEVTYFNVDFQEAAAMPEGYTPTHQSKQIKGTLLFGANALNRSLAELIRAYFNAHLPDHYFKVLASEQEARMEAWRLLRDGSLGHG